ncbi:LysM domain-containing protein [Cordyceps militaris CM01]|uniref:LysM domain-containing protein n=1 Tax=Cordyceps militaris (strain CM01) TaxID=983644 RepID=G3JS98_CORMM|nr:LysM domain-containing protein [Cordyceps militaris CM01]EGX88797.1 LysM domain-containing protein [Cordyceps militaris CM01]
MKLLGIRVALLGLFQAHIASAIHLWEAPGSIPNSVPARCRAQLARNIDCAQNLTTPRDVLNGGALSPQLAQAYCTSGCRDSLLDFQKNVQDGCGDVLYNFYDDGGFKQSGSVLAAGFIWAYQATCIKDSSGFCLQDLNNGTKDLCSDCALKYGAVMASSDWGNDKMNPAQFSSLLKYCSADPSSYPYSHATLPIGTVTPSSTVSVPTVMPTCTGALYTAKNGDTCQSISKDKKMSTDGLININHLDYNCTMLTAGQTLCIQGICKTYTVAQNDTCDSIVKGQIFSTVQLFSWNPTSPLFSSWVPATPVSSYSATTTTWYSATFQPNRTVPTSTMTFNATSDSLVAEITKYCWITDEMWDSGFNEDDFPPGCQALFSTYCFPASADAPVPTSPAHIPQVCVPTVDTYTPPPPPVPTPTPIQPGGMVDHCRKFYRVEKGDFCQKIADAQNITLDNAS